MRKYIISFIALIGVFSSSVLAQTTAVTPKIDTGASSCKREKT